MLPWYLLYILFVILVPIYYYFIITLCGLEGLLRFISVFKFITNYFIRPIDQFTHYFLMYYNTSNEYGSYMIYSVPYT